MAKKWWSHTKNLFIHFRHNAYEYQCVYMWECVCLYVCAESLGDSFAIFVAYFCAPKITASSLLFLLSLEVCVCVSVFACKLQLMIFIFLSACSSLPRPNHLRIFLLLSPLSTTLSHYLFDCCHVRLFRCRCRCCCCSSAFFISCTQSWSKEGIIK